MAFDVTQFRSAMTGDGARANLFDVSLSFPDLAGGVPSSDKTRFMCKSAQLPASTLGIVTAQYFGRELKFSGNRTFADWTITIINDEDFMIRNAFEAWMNGINSHITNIRNPVFDGIHYTRDATVTQYGKSTGKAIKTYNFVGLFPTEVSAIDVDWGTNDAIEEFTVNLAYQYWIADSTSQSKVATEPSSSAAPRSVSPFG